MNPNFLLKDKLQFKLCIQGISSEGNTLALQKLFRSVVSRQGDYLKSVSIDKWCSCTDLKICELPSLVTQSKPSLSFVGPRVRPWLLHLRGRLHHLTDAGLCTLCRETAAVEQFLEQLENIEQLMQGAGQPDRSTGEGSSLQAGRPEDNLNSCQASVPSHNVAMSFTPGVYQKLANPLNYLLK
jgi:hypothetical protein